MNDPSTPRASAGSVVAGTRSSVTLDGATSPSPSMFSRAQSSRSSVSTSSMTSSPLPLRDSFDLYGSIKRLEDVREEPQEREDGLYGDIMGASFSDTTTADYYPTTDVSYISQMEYSLGDQDAWSTTSSGRHPFKRQRSANNRNSITERVANRFGSISRRIKTRSTSGPQLSIVTNNPNSRRSSSATSSHILSPALSVISKHESYLPASPIQTGINDMPRDSATMPLFIEEEVVNSESEWDEPQVTTPLLPPVLAELLTKNEQPFQSPLQSPAMAPAGGPGSKRVSVDNNVAYLPSPPLSTRPSMASLPRSPSALQTEIPPLTLYEEATDAWDDRLGHANFQIHPEPYEPETIDVDSYKEFRANWDLARKQYAQHIARTSEHYGGTSRVYKLTQQKWDEIDDAWKRQDNLLSDCLSETLAGVSTAVLDADLDSSNLLEKPQTRVIVPAFGQSGKFPEIGDADIVGPLTVAPAKAPELQRKSCASPPSSPKKRNLFKYLSDVLARHHHAR